MYYACCYCSRVRGLHNLCFNLRPMVTRSKVTRNNGRSDYHLLLWFHLTSIVEHRADVLIPKTLQVIPSFVCPCCSIAEGWQIQETNSV